MTIHLEDIKVLVLRCIEEHPNPDDQHKICVKAVREVLSIYRLEQGSSVRESVNRVNTALVELAPTHLVARHLCDERGLLRNTPTRMELA